MNKNLHQLFSAWGKSQQQLPKNNQSLKDATLTRLVASTTTATHHSYGAPWLSMAFAGLAVFVLIFTSSGPTPSGIMPMDASVTSAPAIGAPAGPPVTTNLMESTSVSQTSATPKSTIQLDSRGEMARDVGGVYPMPPYRYDEVPVNDTREFLKTDYSATIRTRKVEELTQQIKAAVHGVDGRVDGLSNSLESGFISFVIPANKLDFFVASIKSLVPARFFVETIQTENLLPQKQSIEQQQNQLSQTLNQLRADREQLVADHRQIVTSIQLQLENIDIETNALLTATTTDPIRRAQINARLQELAILSNNLGAQLVDENKIYTQKLTMVDSQINGHENSLEYTNQQDQRLLDTVATVRGTIYVDWISYWEIIGLYTPSYWPSIILAITAIIAYINYRRKSRLIIP